MQQQPCAGSSSSALWTTYAGHGEVRVLHHQQQLVDTTGARHHCRRRVGRRAAVAACSEARRGGVVGQEANRQRAHVGMGMAWQDGCSDSSKC